MTIKIKAEVTTVCDADGSKPYRARIIRERDWRAINRVLRVAHKWYTSPLTSETRGALDDALSEAMFALIEGRGR